MNWSRTKSIFILVFLLLNSFLGYQLWEKQTKKLEIAQLYEGSIEDMLAVKNIALEAELRVDQPELSQLNTQLLAYTFQDLDQLEGQQISFEEHRLLAQLRTPLTLSEAKREEELGQFVESQVTRGEDYAFDQQVGNRLFYVQQVDGLPIFNSTLIFELNERQQVTGYQQVYYHVINQATQQPVISSFSCLRTLLDQQLIPAEAVIKQVQLGYFGQVYGTENQILTPTWRVRIQVGENRLHYYVNAYTGAIEAMPK